MTAEEPAVDYLSRIGSVSWGGVGGNELAKKTEQTCHSRGTCGLWTRSHSLSYHG